MNFGPIKTEDDFKEIKKNNKGIILITDISTGDHIHTPSCSFVTEENELIEFRQHNEIRIHLSDRTLQNKKQYGKWINICGTMDQGVVEQVSIGKNHYDGKKFRFTCRPSIGIAGKTADNIDITLKLM